jgi:hypothetical protein
MKLETSLLGRMNTVPVFTHLQRRVQRPHHSLKPTITAVIAEPTATYLRMQSSPELDALTYLDSKT